MFARLRASHAMPQGSVVRGTGGDVIGRVTDCRPIEGGFEFTAELNDEHPDAKAILEGKPLASVGEAPKEYVDGADIVEVTVGFSQNYRPNPHDQFVMARMEMQVRAILHPQIGRDLREVKNDLFQLCRREVLTTIDIEVAAAERAAREEESFN